MEANGDIMEISWKEHDRSDADSVNIYLSPYPSAISPPPLTIAVEDERVSQIRFSPSPVIVSQMFFAHEILPPSTPWWFDPRHF